MGGLLQHPVHFIFVIDGALPQRVGFEFRLRPFVKIGNDDLLQIWAVAKGENQDRRDEQKSEYAADLAEEPAPKLATLATLATTPRAALPVGNHLAFTDQPDRSRLKRILSHALSTCSLRASLAMREMAEQRLKIGQAGNA